jgi:hypothetical protein
MREEEPPPSPVRDVFRTVEFSPQCIHTHTLRAHGHLPFCHFEPPVTGLKWLDFRSYSVSPTHSPPFVHCLFQLSIHTVRPFTPSVPTIRSQFVHTVLSNRLFTTISSHRPSTTVCANCLFTTVPSPQYYISVYLMERLPPCTITLNVNVIECGLHSASVCQPSRIDYVMTAGSVGFLFQSSNFFSWTSVSSLIM